MHALPLLQVNVRILGGLMALGYEIGSILKRTSRVWQDDHLMIKIDEIDGMEHKFVQVGLRLCNRKQPGKVQLAWVERIAGSLVP